MRTLYGPIDSWRFGRSLGVDPLAARSKRCPFSCTYCQYGPTGHPTHRRQAFVTVEQVRAEIDALGPVSADCITFAGLGEPALATNLPELVASVRQAFSLPVILLTGSGLMPRSDVRTDLLPFDTVVAKLDAPNEKLFRQISRPGSGFPYRFAAVVAGIRRFREIYRGKLVLQMMFLQSNVHGAPQMAALARSLAPDEVQLNTPLQPALGGPVSAVQMQVIESAFAGLPVRSVYDGDQARTRPRFL